MAIFPTSNSSSLTSSITGNFGTKFSVTIAFSLLIAHCAVCQNWISEVLLNEYSNEKPWELKTSKNYDVEPRSSVMDKIIEGEFDPKIDDIDKEIENAAQGDLRALAKITDFLWGNPDSPKRIQILRVRARTGARAMASYFCEIRKKKHEEDSGIQEVFSAIGFLKKRSDDGDWVSSLVLMRFFGELSFKACNTEIGESSELVKEFIETAYKNGDMEKLNNAMKFEKIRIGWANRVSSVDVFPYVETGWVPNVGQ